MEMIKISFTGILCFLLLLNAIPGNTQKFLPPPKNGKIYVIAHRGVHKNIPENSLPAYQKAIDLGCDFVEIDARTTRDNKVVSIHNNAIDAYVNGKSGKVRDLDLADIKKLDIGEKIGNEWKNTRIPTFDEILELCQGKIGIYLDLKDADPEVLIEKIRKYKMASLVVWYIPASRHKTIMEVKQSCQECMIMPDPGSAENIERVSIAYDPSFLATDMENLSMKFVELAHSRQSKVFVDDSEDDPSKWTAEWKKIIHWGTDGIQTDNPEELINFIKEK